MVTAIASQSIPPGSHVLIVDDDPLLSGAFGMVLRKAGLEVELCNGGHAALASVAQRTPALVLLDFMMPDLTGPEVARRLRADPRLRSVPILLLTACDEGSQLEEGFSAGADDYLIKPVDFRILVARVKAALRAA